MAVYRIALDPGHGGGDSGAILPGYNQNGISTFKEKYLTEGITRYLHDYLSLDPNFDSYITRNITDISEGATQKARADKISDFGADLSISIHSNAGGTLNGGFEVYVRSPQNPFHEESLRFGYIVAQKVGALSTYAPRGNRGVKYCYFDGVNESNRIFSQPPDSNPNGYIDYYTVIDDVNCPSCLCETCFTDVISDIINFDTEAKWRTAAYAYYQAICEFFSASASIGIGQVAEKTIGYSLDSGTGGGSPSDPTIPSDNQAAEVYSSIPINTNFGIVPSSYVSTYKAPVVNLYAGNQANGTRVCLWQQDYSKDQGWNLSSVDDGSYKIASVYNPRKVMSVKTALTGSTTVLSEY